MTDDPPILTNEAPTMTTAAPTDYAATHRLLIEREAEFDRINRRRGPGDAARLDALSAEIRELDARVEAMLRTGSGPRPAPAAAPAYRAPQPPVARPAPAAAAIRPDLVPSRRVAELLSFTESGAELARRILAGLARPL